MASPYLSQQGEPYLSFEGGIDRENARTFLDRTLYGSYSLYHAYEDAQNIILTSDTSGKHPTTVRGDVALDTLVNWPDAGANLIWFAPFTTSALASNVLSFSTHLLRAQANGAVWRYDSGTPGTNTLVRRGFTTANLLWTHLTYDQWLVTFNGRDAPMKYGQHLFYEGQQEPRPHLTPLGAKLITPFVNNTFQTAGEVWTFQANSGFVADTAVPGGGARSGPESLQIKVSNTVTLTYTASTNGSSATFTSRNFLDPPQPYSAAPPQFAGSDFLIFQYYKAAAGSNLKIVFRFLTSAGNNFELAFVPTVFGSWATAKVLRSAATTTGAPTWATITSIEFVNTDALQDVFVDDAYFLYSTAPPAGQVGEVHQERIVLAGVPTSATTLASLYWSNAKAPDHFPGSNTQVMTTSSDLLARTNQVNALREYADTVIVGMPNALLSWTIGTDGLATKATITSTIGMDAHRAVVETPTGALLFPWQRGIYALRATGRQYASAKIAPLLANVSLDDPAWTVGVIDEKTKTARFWFRQGTGATTTSLGLVFDYVRAQERGEPVWPSQLTQVADFATPAFISGARETLYGRYNSPAIMRLGAKSTGTLTSSVTLPWMSRTGRDRVVKWIGLTAPLATAVPVQVQIRYASNPGEFDNAVFSTVDTIPALNAVPTANTVVQEARVNFGGSTRWAQVRFLATQIGFELFPPVELVALTTQRSP